MRTFLILISLISVKTQCSPGFYRFNNVCTQCAAGTYNELAGQTECNVCPRGTYSSAGARTCQQCGLYFYADTVGSESCKSCSDKFFEGYGDILCYATYNLFEIPFRVEPPGTKANVPGTFFVSANSKTISFNCPAGSFSSSAKNMTRLTDNMMVSNSLCSNNCLYASNDADIGALFDLNFETGIVQNRQIVQKVWIYFNANTYVDSVVLVGANGNVQGNNIFLNGYNDATDVGTSGISAAGRFLDLTDSSLIGRMSPLIVNVKTSVSNLLFVGSSLYGFALSEIMVFGQSPTCTPCPAGTYANGYVPSRACVECELNTYQSLAGQGACISCSAGKYTSVTGATACTECPANTYEQNRVCVACVSPQVSAAGSAQCECPINMIMTGSECVCRPGFGGVAPCVVCSNILPSNAVYVQSCTWQCNAGFYASGSQCLPCITCSGDKVLKTECTATSNAVCDNKVSCAAGQYWRPNFCTACAAGTYSSVANATSCSSCSGCNLPQYVQSTCTSSANTICQNCSVCNALSWTMSACTVQNNTRCANCSTCTSGSYIVSPCSRNSDTMCTNCSTCNTGQYVRSACTVSNNTVCANCSTCTSGSYIVSPCSRNSDTMCINCSTCNAGQYVRSACTVSNNTVCANCSTCTSGSYIVSPCSRNSDTMCTNCSTCNAGQYVRSACTMSNNTVCANCSTCATGSYAATACMGVSDTVCARCSECTDNEYMVAPCAANADAVCAACTVCGTNKFLTTACTWASDTVCSSCGTCSTTQFIQNQCNATHDVVCANCTSCAPGTYQIAPCTQVQNTQCAACVPVPNSQWTSACNYRCLLNYQLPLCTLIPIDNTVSATLANIDLPSAVCRVPEWTTKLRSFYGTRALIVSLTDNVSTVSCYPDPCLCSRATRRLLEDPLVTMTFWYEGSNQASSGIQYVIPEITAVSVKADAARTRTSLWAMGILCVMLLIKGR